jgi:hypothetical protein
MAKGISLHIAGGLVDKNHYVGWEGGISPSCENDAASMKAIAEKCGFQALPVVSGISATADNVLTSIHKVAQTLVPDDILFLTYAGEGAQIPDINHDEPDGLDDTWVLYDRMLIDDELNDCWNRFDKGVRIVLISDSCSSGSIISLALVRSEFAGKSANTNRAHIRSMPQDLATQTYYAHADLYNSKQLASNMAVPKSTVLSLTSSEDGKPSSADDEHGAFTRSLLFAWKDGQFQGHYGNFYAAIYLDLKKKGQQPQYEIRGTPNSSFENQKPFTI